jgi:1-aminocyclopropane-1-carboxylate deaminase
MQELSPHNITVDKLSIPLFKEKGIEADVLRLDKIHPVISGNKWFKLRFYLEEAMKLGKHKILSFGGAWSNHIVATAAAAKLYGFTSTGLIRGEAGPTPSPTLTQAAELGMEIIFLNRQDYLEKKIPKEQESDEYYIIPEGGYGKLGAMGAATILDHSNWKSYSHLCCAAGTGTMMAGIINASQPSQKIIGVSVLKNNEPANEAVQAFSHYPPVSFRRICQVQCGTYQFYECLLPAKQYSFGFCLYR